MSGKRLVLWCLDGVLIPEGSFDDEVLRQVCGHLLGRPCEQLASRRGGTTMQAVRETLRLNGVTGGQLDILITQAGQVLTDAVSERRAELIAGDRVPGATEVLLTLRMRGDVYQSLLCGDVEQAARAKANAFEFDRYLDAIDVGGYGSDGADFGELIEAAAEKFRTVHGQDPAMVVITCTPQIVAAASGAAAGVVAVAGNPAQAAALREAGAGHVLADLTDAAAVTAAIDAL